ncbi:sodium-coupled neutral amino acid transporter 9 homolog [Plutella xylostella]|uniref:sodium-coupled neutral amino acid transporter 9 homolog n=1 Tax=Plutella xylostella TaxID=51655 RepID=UPI002032971B|nr:sodium-coupled neutral amino acid transporter 9 homolog [Plutella xylostella]
MRFVYRNTPKRSYEDLSSPSSVQSVDSYELFGSAGSDYSDCELCDERRRRTRHSAPTPASYSNTAPSSSPSAMDRTDRAERDARDRTHSPAHENTPLLAAPPAPPAYTVVRDSDSLGPADLSSKAVLTTMDKLERDKEKIPERKKKQSSLVTIFSLWNTTMGSSLLTMAWGVERAGLAAALALLAGMGAACLFTAHTLLRVNKHHGGATCEVPALCRTLLGRTAETIAHGFSLLVLLGANIVYWILITNFLYFTVNYLMDLPTTYGTIYNTTLTCRTDLNGTVADTAGSPYWDLHSTVPVYVACLVFPLLISNNASFFTNFNSLGTLSVLYLLIFVIFKGSVWGINFNSTLVVTHAGKDAAALSGMLALSFYIHNIIITIMNNNDRQEKNGRDLTIAFVLVTITYTLVGTIFYICFPLVKTCIEDNLLNNFEMHDVMTAVARVLLLFQVITVYPLVAYMLRSEALLLLPLRGAGGALLVNVGIVTVCVLFACFCPNISTIIRYTGALSGLVHVFALPALLQARSLHVRGRLTAARAAPHVFVLLLGVANFAMQFFIDE